MSEQPVPARVTVNRDQLRARLNQLSFFRQQGIVGPAELVGLAGSVIV